VSGLSAQVFTMFKMRVSNRCVLISARDLVSSSRLWQNSVLFGCRREVLISFLAVS
jgi:hypothetical protein